jgi:hypothetical protein
MAALFKHPKNLPASYHKPIGQLLVRWSVTELYLQSIIWHIWKLKDPKVARLLTWDLQAVSKVELFRHLSPRWITDPVDRAELKAIATDADALREKRNRVAHGLWGYKPGKPENLYLFQINRKTRVLPKAKLVSVADMKQWAVELDRLNGRLIKLHGRLGAPEP